MNNFEKFDKYISHSSFILTGLTSYLRLYAVSNCAKLGNKVLFITSTEVSAQKYQSDLQKIFGIAFANFNIADSCLVVGAFMLVFYVLFLDADPVFSCFKKKRELKKQGGQQAENENQALGEDEKAVQIDNVENLDD